MEYTMCDVLQHVFLGKKYQDMNNFKGYSNRLTTGICTIQWSMTNSPRTHCVANKTYPQCGYGSKLGYPLETAILSWQITGILLTNMTIGILGVR